MQKCIMCGSESYWHKFCYKCNETRSNACSIIKQNTVRLEKLFKTKWYNLSWFEKFDLYIKNIQKQKDILEKFIEADLLRKLK